MERDNEPRKNINVRGAEPRRLNTVKGRLTRKWGVGVAWSRPQGGEGNTEGPQSHAGSAEPSRKGLSGCGHSQSHCWGPGGYTSQSGSRRGVCECYTEKVAGSEQGNCMLRLLFQSGPSPPHRGLASRAWVEMGGQRETAGVTLGWMTVAGLGGAAVKVGRSG